MPRLLLLLLPLALSACSSPSPEGPVLVDRITTPPAASENGVLSPERLLIEGSAQWVATTVGDLMERRAVTPAERERARRALASGVYLEDDAHIVRLTPPDVTEARYQAGTAYLTDAFAPEAAPGPFRMSLTFHMAGSDGATAGLTVELRDPGSSPTGDVGQVLITLMDPGTSATSQLTVSTRGTARSDIFEPVASLPLAARDWRGSHRLDMDYAPGSLALHLDGEPLVTAPVRLTRPVGPVYVGVFAMAPTMGVSLVDWTLSSR